MEVKVVKRILANTEVVADAIKKELAARGNVAINIMGTPGAGKTTLLERTFLHFRRRFPMAVIEGDIATTKDAHRLKKLGLDVVQINTDRWGGSCHLDANMVQPAVRKLASIKNGIVFVENVGNLVCPAAFDVGETYKVVVTSVAEGDDKPSKYPIMFRTPQMIVLNKIDMIRMTDFNMARFKRDVKAVNPDAKLALLSARSGKGLEMWFRWVEGCLVSK
ncbi:MAG: hydrogenase nickel incorporation protein HypB [Planctomycetota bacterium]|nr:hydrogenase nickel incorporation protein HypB [Planctomycetota bacterium]